MAFELPKLPYALNALEPHISKETLEYHYGKHHQAYVTKLNSLLENSPLAAKSLEEVILAAKAGDVDNAQAVFNNAAQVWNHTFYWHCLSPNGGKEPTGKLAQAIHDKFGSLETFINQFSQAAINTFGSGWAWLVKDKNNNLEIISTSNAGTPLTEGKTALLTCDVWEHAYYIDYRNMRPKYVEIFWNLVNWDFVAHNFAR